MQLNLLKASGFSKTVIITVIAINRGTVYLNYNNNNNNDRLTAFDPGQPG